MNKYISRLTSSSRGEAFNKLAWLFLGPTFFVGLAVSIGVPLGLGGTSQSMATALDGIFPNGALIWGIIAVFNIAMGVTFLAFQKPPFGKASGLIGFMLWVWAGISFSIENLYLLVLVICVPQAMFWIWQYLMLARYRDEDKIDTRTLKAYNAGEYDDEDNPKDALAARENNRGMDVQSQYSYDNPDDGTDLSRPLDSDK
jgi:hypothetical protein